MNEVRIKVTGDATALDPTIAKLQEVGKVDAKNAAQFNKSHEEFKKQHAEKESLLERLTSGTENKMERIAEYVAAAFATEKIIEFGKESVKAFAEEEAAINKLKFAIVTINGETSLAFKRLNEQAEKLSESLDTLFTPTQIRNTQLQLANFGLTAKQIEKVIPRILDISKATGKDLPAATEKAILAINGQTKGLRDIGVAFKDTGSKTENFNLLLGQTEKFAGAAGEALNTTQGSIDKWGNKFEELHVTVGQFLKEAGSELLDTLEYMAGGFLDASNADSKLNTGMKFTVEQMKELTELTKKMAVYNLQILESKGGDGIALQKAEQQAKKALLENYIDDVAEMNDKALDKELKEIQKAKAVKEDATIKTDADLKKILEGAGQKRIDNLITLSQKEEAILKEIETRKAKIKEDMTLKGEAEAEAAEKKAAAEKKKRELKEFDEDYKEAERQLKKQEALINGALSPMEKENKAFDDRLKAAGLFYVKKEDMDDFQRRAYEAAEEEHQKNITAIIEKEEKERMERIKTIINNELEARKLGFKQLLVAKKISADEYQVEVDRLEIEALKRQQDLGDQSIELENKIQSAKLKLQEDAATESKNIIQKNIEAVKSFFELVGNAFESVVSAQVDAIDHQVTIQKDAIDQQTKLAQAGKANDLAFELKRQSDLEAQRAKEKKNLIKFKELEILLNSIANFSKDNSITAVFKAIGLMGSVKQAESQYMEHGGLVGENQSMTNFKGFTRLHPGGGDVLVHAQTGEGMLSRKDISNMGGPKAFLSFKDALAGPLKERAIPLSYVSSSTMNTTGIEKRLESLEQTIKDKPEMSVDFDGMTNMIVTRTKAGIKEAITYVMKKPGL